MLGNKNDLPGALQAKALIEKLNLKVWKTWAGRRTGGGKWEASGEVGRAGGKGELHERKTVDEK